MSAPYWRIEDDKKSMTITFPAQQTVEVNLRTEGLDELLQSLGMSRAAMLPTISEPYVPGQKFSSVFDPAWYVDKEMMLGNLAFHVRDPRFGWLHYTIPLNEAKKLCDLLQKLTQNDQPPLSPQGKAN